MKRKKLKVITTLLVIGLFLIVPSNTVASEAIVTSVSHSPTEVSIDTVVTVEITFSDTTDITDVQIQYCAIEPEYVCYFPRSVMYVLAGNTWEGNFTVKEASDIIGYEIFISFTNGSSVTAPDSLDYLGYSNIAEPLTDVFYFTIEFTTTTQTAPLGISFVEIGFGIGIIFIIYTLKEKRKKS